MDANNNNGEINKDARRELLIVKGNSPLVWDALIKSNICPMEFGLPCTCNAQQDCKTCWEQSLELEELDPSVKISLNGKFFCAQDMNFLVKVKTSSGVEIYECPTCHNKWDIKLNDNKHIQSIKKKQDDPQEKPPEKKEEPSSSKVDENYNEE